VQGRLLFACQPLVRSLSPILRGEVTRFISPNPVKLSPISAASPVDSPLRLDTITVTLSTVDRECKVWRCLSEARAARLIEAGEPRPRVCSAAPSCSHHWGDVLHGTSQNLDDSYADFTQGGGMRLGK
jgi:hypothetical protein